MNPDYRAIGKRIREKRIKKSMTQEALAAAVGISNPHMSNIERGKTKVSLPVLISIANHLDTTADELLCDSLNHSKIVFDQEIFTELEECDGDDTKIVYDMMKALI